MSGDRPPRGASFDRVRPRAAHARGTSSVPPPPPASDVDGKRALFSGAPPVPARGSLAVACGGCGAKSVLSARQALRALVPSLHLPLLRRNRSYLRCPACSRWEWCHLTLRL